MLHVQLVTDILLVTKGKSLSFGDFAFSMSRGVCQLFNIHQSVNAQRVLSEVWRQALTVRKRLQRTLEIPVAALQIFTVV